MFGLKAKTGTHDREVSPLGWAWLVLGVLIALFWGGALRVLGSEQFIRQWVEQQLQKENPKVQVEFVFAKLQLAKGGWPTLGVHFQGLVIKSQDPCAWGGTLSAERAFIPLSFWRLLQGEVRAGEIDLGPTHLNLTPPLCTSKRDGSEGASKVITATASLGPGELSERWIRELSGTFHWLEELRVEALELRGTDRDGVYLLRDFHLYGGGEPLAFKVSLKFKVTGGRWAAFFSEPMAFKMEGGRDGIKWESSLPMREGLFRIQGRLDLPTHHYSVRLLAGQVPISLILEGLSKLGLTRSPVEVRRMWLSLRSTLSGAANFSTPPQLELELFKVDGESGLISLPQPKVGSLTDFFKESPLVLKVERLDIQSLLEISGRHGYRGVIEKFGQLVGELSVYNLRDLKFSGELKDMGLRFSRDRIPVIQKIPVMRGQWSYRDHQFNAEINEVEFSQGSLTGKADFALDQTMRNGDFRVAWETVRLAPEVNKLMLGHTEAEWSLHGRGKMQDGKVLGWRGEFRFPDLRVGVLNLKGGVLTTSFAEGVMKLTLQAGEAQVQVEEASSPQLKPLVEEMAQGKTPLSLTRIRGDLDVFSEGVRWINFRAQTRSGGWQILSQGQWLKDAQVDGWLRVTSSGHSKKQWRINGLWPDLNVLREASP